MQRFQAICFTCWFEISSRNEASRPRIDSCYRPLGALESKHQNPNTREVRDRVKNKLRPAAAQTAVATIRSLLWGKRSRCRLRACIATQRPFNEVRDGRCSIGKSRSTSFMIFWSKNKAAQMQPRNMHHASMQTAHIRHDICTTAARNIGISRRNLKMCDQNGAQSGVTGRVK